MRGDESTLDAMHGTVVEIGTRGAHDVGPPPMALGRRRLLRQAARRDPVARRPERTRHQPVDQRRQHDPRRRRGPAGREPGARRRRHAPPRAAGQPDAEPLPVQGRSGVRQQPAARRAAPCGQGRTASNWWRCRLCFFMPYYWLDVFAIGLLQLFVENKYGSKV